MGLTKQQISWVIKNRERQEKRLTGISDQEEKEKYRKMIYAKNNTRRFFYVDRCISYLSGLSGSTEKCVNFTVYYTGRFVVSLDWAAKHNLPNQCYWHDARTDWVELTPFGLNWAFDYLLHRNRVLVVRKVSGIVPHVSDLPDRIR